MVTPLPEWRPVVGVDHYEVSDSGRVRSLTRTLPFRSGSRTYRGTELTPSVDRRGRRSVQLGRGDTRLVAVLVLEAFVGPRPPSMMGCHNSGDPADNAVGNLRWGTQSSNMHDRVRHGTDPHVGRADCPRDHPLVEPNLVPSEPGRKCLACARAHSYVRYWAQRGVTYDLRDEANRYHAAIVGAAA